MKKYTAIGLMSGSSLDGLDLVYADFWKDETWFFSIKKSAAIPLKKWIDILQNLRNISPVLLQEKSTEFGQFTAEKVTQFIQSNQIDDINLIASHGHTIFHFPEKGITCQIGDGQTIANHTRLKTISNLRQRDIDLGGSGAPIVPIGDLNLFSEYTFCLNIGGIANSSIKCKDKIIAFDHCAANQVLNHYALQKGAAYDDNGKWASNGKVNNDLLNDLNEVTFYKKSYPKSLDNGFSSEIIQIIEKYKLSIEDKLATYCAHIGKQIAKDYALVAEQENINSTDKKLLITGGGAYHTFLVGQIKKHTKLNVIIPSNEIIEYKEALVMAFMGVLHSRNEINCLHSVTGAKQDSICGELFHPKSEK
ncbi:MAG: anhydro-N-acetylmuramic acid kinase [Chitinophagales bacterium]